MSNAKSFRTIKLLWQRFPGIFHWFWGETCFYRQCEAKVAEWKRRNYYDIISSDNRIHNYSRSFHNQFQFFSNGCLVVCGNVNAQPKKAVRVEIWARNIFHHSSRNLIVLPFWHRLAANQLILASRDTWK